MISKDTDIFYAVERTPRHALDSNQLICTEDVYSQYLYHEPLHITDVHCCAIAMCRSQENPLYLRFTIRLLSLVYLKTCPPTIHRYIWVED